MAITTTQPIWIPPLAGLNAITTSAPASMTTVMTFDAGTDALALITRIPETGTLTAIEFHTGTVSAAGATFSIRVETVDGSGLPSGTLAYTNANGTVVVNTTDDNSWMSVSLNSGSGVSVTQGDLVAIVLGVSSGTPNTVIVNSSPTSIQTLTGSYPYLVLNTTGSYAKSTNGNPAPFALSYGGTYVGCNGASVVNGTSATAIGNDNEVALRFFWPVGVRVIGGRAYLINVTAGADFTIRLCNSSGTALATVSIDGDVTSGATVDGWYDWTFSSSVDLSASTEYFMSIHQTTANSLTVLQATFASNAYMAAFQSGQSMYLGTRTGGSGSFSTTTTTMPMIQLICDGVDDGLGGGRASLLLGI